MSEAHSPNSNVAGEESVPTIASPAGGPRTGDHPVEGLCTMDRLMRGTSSSISLLGHGSRIRQVDNILPKGSLWKSPLISSSPKQGHSTLSPLSGSFTSGSSVLSGFNSNSLGKSGFASSSLDRHVCKSPVDSHFSHGRPVPSASASTSLFEGGLESKTPSGQAFMGSGPIAGTLAADSSSEMYPLLNPRETHLQVPSPSFSAVCLAFPTLRPLQPL